MTPSMRSRLNARTGFGRRCRLVSVSVYIPYCVRSLFDAMMQIWWVVSSTLPHTHTPSWLLVAQVVYNEIVANLASQSTIPLAACLLPESHPMLAAELDRRPCCTVAPCSDYFVVRAVGCSTAVRCGLVNQHHLRNSIICSLHIKPPQVSDLFDGRRLTDKLDATTRGAKRRRGKSVTDGVAWVTGEVPTQTMTTNHPQVYKDTQWRALLTVREETILLKQEDAWVTLSKSRLLSS